MNRSVGLNRLLVNATLFLRFKIHNLWEANNVKICFTIVDNEVLIKDFKS